MQAINYLLDTNAWFRLFDRPEQIAPSTISLLRTENVLALSSISLIEVAQKNASKRGPLFTLPIDRWFLAALPSQRIKIFDITPEIAAKTYDLGPDFHGDPADRIIAATAIIHNLVLVTSDELLLSNPLIQTLATNSSG
ncbi:type II toxin-antitoxin system VapC family toxin [Phragmitibacter flavus]|uniref:Type II toxin-antitoxin system VapC family toxin n=1 Tax=Phragmitibacter flavus TaxID=2576071 RepID=A0A5R8KC78_9BACT|nr:type II toxin-antitoxin system VapC family toxin [Phragmitibacter flavus]TLD69837.1 type II toxin-antitoxin system VapC family toxin [Phragmitibacter flavus]